MRWALAAALLRSRALLPPPRSLAPARSSGNRLLAACAATPPRADAAAGDPGTRQRAPRRVTLGPRRAARGASGAPLRGSAGGTPAPSLASQRATAPSPRLPADSQSSLLAAATAGGLIPFVIRLGAFAPASRTPAAQHRCRQTNAAWLDAVAAGKDRPCRKKYFRRSSALRSPCCRLTSGPHRKRSPPPSDEASTQQPEDAAAASFFDSVDGDRNRLRTADFRDRDPGHRDRPPRDRAPAARQRGRPAARPARRRRQRRRPEPGAAGHPRPARPAGPVPRGRPAAQQRRAARPTSARSPAWSTRRRRRGRSGARPGVGALRQRRDRRRAQPGAERPSLRRRRELRRPRRAPATAPRRATRGGRLASPAATGTLRLAARRSPSASADDYDAPAGSFRRHPARRRHPGHRQRRRRRSALGQLRLPVSTRAALARACAPSATAPTRPASASSSRRRSSGDAAFRIRILYPFQDFDRYALCYDGSALELRRSPTRSRPRLYRQSNERQLVNDIDIDIGPLGPGSPTFVGRRRHPQLDRSRHLGPAARGDARRSVGRTS